MRSAQHAKTHRDESRDDGSSIHQATYHLDPPLDLAPHHLHGQATHVLISTSIDPRHKISETIVAPAKGPDTNRISGEVQRTPPTTHAEALARLGYALTHEEAPQGGASGTACSS